MGLNVNFRTLSQFDGDDGLSRRVSQLEGNVSNALDAIAGQALPTFSPTDTKTADYIADLGDLVTLDSSGGNRNLRLPVASAKNAGRMVLLARPSASNAITALAASGQINRASTYTVAAAVGLTIFVSDGKGWWAK